MKNISGYILIPCIIVLSSFLISCEGDDSGTGSMLPGNIGTETEKSSDADLKYLSVNGYLMTPVFSGTTTAYAVEVPEGTSTVDVTAVGAQYSSVALDGAELSASNMYTSSIVLGILPQEITVSVLAEDSESAKQYIITVDDPPDEPPSEEARLEALEITSGDMIPSFDADLNDYVVELSHSVTSINITPTVMEANAAVTVNGENVVSTTPKTIDVTSLPPDGGVTTMDVIVVVTAEDGTTTNEYTITLSKDTPPPTESRLLTLVISAGTMEPGFSSNTYNYDIEVPEDTASIDLTPTAMDEVNAVIEIDGETVASGSVKTVSLTSFPAEIIIDLTAGDDVTTSRYTLTVDEEEDDGGSGCGN